MTPSASRPGGRAPFTAPAWLSAGASLLLACAALAADGPGLDIQRRQATQLEQAQGRLMAEADHLSAGPEAGDPGQVVVAETPCFTLAGIDWLGAQDFPWLVELAVPFQGQCLGAQSLKRLRDYLTLALLARGYVTSRVVYPGQNLADGTLTIQLIPGRLGAVREIGPGAGRIDSVLATRTGDLINQRDLDQSLENLRRLGSESASRLDLVPGRELGESELVIHHGRDSRHQGSLSLDDAGARSTGKHQLGLTLGLDSPLGLYDQLALTLNGNADYRNQTLGSRASGLQWSLPLGYASYSLGINQSNYKQSVAGYNGPIVYTGATRALETALGLTSYRASTYKGQTQLKLYRKISRNYIDGAEIAAQARDAVGWELTLSAGNSLTARYAPQTSVSQEKASNTAASIGIGFGTDGLYLTASAQVGNARGEALKEDNGETHLRADNLLTLLAGGDASLKGAMATGERIEADIGGNLTLASLQDSERYRYKSGNAGGSVQIGYGKFAASINASRQNINNAYQSVVEQTGLHAGAGGFDIDVGGATRLEGAVIASTAGPDQNRLATESLSYTDLTNFEQTRVSGYSFGLGTGPGSNYITPVAGADTNRSSVTQAVISAGAVEVRDLAGKDRGQLLAESQAQQARVATLQGEVEKLKAQKAQAAPYQQYKSLLPLWKGFLEYAKANPGVMYWYPPWQLSIPLGALIPHFAKTIALIEADPANLQSLIDQANVQLVGTQPELQAALDLLSQFQAIDTLAARDLASANPALKNGFDVQRTRAHLEAMQVFSETAMRVVGDVFRNEVKDSGSW